MKTNVLFIANGSLANPILQTQGLPYLNNLDSSIYAPHVLSFERKNWSDEIDERIEFIKSRFGERINFHYVEVGGKNLTSVRFLVFTRSLKILRSLVKTFDIKILHARNFFSAFISVIIKIFFKSDLKILYDSRGLAIEERIFSGQLNKLSEKILIILEKIIVNKSDSIVVVSEKLKEHLLNKHGNSILKKINIINNKTIIPSVNSELTEIKSDLFYTGVYSGSAAGWQNLNGMMELFKIAFSRFDNIKIKILTWQKDRFIKKLINYPELNNKIELLSLEQEKVFDNLINCNFGIIFRGNNLISRVSSPLKFSEYLAAGLPVLINEGVGDMEDIILQNNIGVIIREENYYAALKEMIDLLKDKQIYSRCRETAAREFNIQDAFNSYQKIYERLLNG
jgi:glycosyltransferase involved in cell wall biosynthesis